VSDLVDDVSNIHPWKKRAVGERLSNLALKELYGWNDLKPYSPHFKHLAIEGEKAFISVASTGKLKSNGQEIINFQLAGADQQFYPANATIKKDGQIQLVSSKVKNPVAVRYCFTNDATSNLFDVNNLPLLPFRTDKW
jgi:sialate O-acetylesterase